MVFDNQTGFYGDRIYFTTNGEIDLTRTNPGNLTDANTALRLVQANLNTKASPLNVQVDFWRLLNWIYVVQYWTLLYDLGQVQPTLYQHNGTAPNNYHPYRFEATNNVFINGSLFQIYNDYFQNTILPLLGIPNAKLPILTPTPANGFAPLNATFQMGYLCTITQPKHWLTLLIAVAVGDYTILHSMYFVMMFFITKWHQNKKHDGGKGTVLAQKLWFNGRQLVRRLSAT